MSVLNDVKFALVPLDASAIPNAPSSCCCLQNRCSLTLPSLGDVKVHDGFQDTFLRTSGTVLNSVRNALAANSATQVLVTGHSLGGAVASMDAVMLRQSLNPSVTIN